MIIYYQSNDIYVGTKKENDDSNKLVKKSDLGGGYITFEDENATLKGTQNVNFGKKVILQKSNEIIPTVATAGENAKVTFEIINDKSIAESKLNDTLKGKIDKIATNERNITLNKNTITTLSNNKITFKDGLTEFERANNSDKTVEFKGEGNLNVKLGTGKTDTGTFTISVNQADSINPEAGNNKQGNIWKHPNRLTTEKAVVDYVKGKIQISWKWWNGSIKQAMERLILKVQRADLQIQGIYVYLKVLIKQD